MAISNDNLNSTIPSRPAPIFFREFQSLSTKKVSSVFLIESILNLEQNGKRGLKYLNNVWTTNLILISLSNIYI